MGSIIAEAGTIPSVSYAELVHSDAAVRDLAAGSFTRALQSYGACRIREHGIPQEMVDTCFEKSTAFFNRDTNLKAAEAGTIVNARYVPFGSEKIRGEAHLDETLEFQYDAYAYNPPPSSETNPSYSLRDACRPFHEECNRIHATLLDALSSSFNLTRPLSSIHSTQNTYFAPYFYHFPDPQDTNPLRVPSHIDPTSLLFNFQDPLGGLRIADLRQTSGRLSATAITDSGTRFISATCAPGEFIVLAGNLLRKIVGERMKHSVHCVERPVGSKGVHLNYWTIPELETVFGMGDGREESVGEYLGRVFPAAFGNPQ
ncbi:hypothetical protein BJX64DRAFT_296185 [Aspergillus heterothallicus]